MPQSGTVPTSLPRTTAAAASASAPPTRALKLKSLDRDGRKGAIEEVVDWCHGLRADDAHVLGTIALTNGTVQIDARKCRHSDAIKVKLDGPAGHREVVIPWKRNHHDKVEEAASKMSEVLGTHPHLQQN